MSTQQPGGGVEPEFISDDSTAASQWQEGVALAVCFISACDYDDIDPRGPVYLRDDPTPYYACTEHWQAIIGILGRQVSSDSESRWAPDNQQLGRQP